MKLPQFVDFDETAYPELLAIFAEIDNGIAALVATDPGLQPRARNVRRSRPTTLRAEPGGKTQRPARRAAA